MIVLDEITEHALRVRVVETGEVGLLPAWDIEGALERLARLNMEFNEAVSFLDTFVPANVSVLTTVYSPGHLSS